ncbi:TPA: DUF551 domain-containing protein [Klebsiella pneumoniae]|nr:DUF551 domain-containing protein [Klebsiella pneumoniae]
MIAGTTNYDDVPDVRCALCGGYYKADDPESHECAEAAQSHAEIECDICGFKSTDPEGAHYCCEDNSGELPVTHWMPLPAAPQEVKGE